MIVDSEHKLRRDAAQNRRKLLDAARRVFDARGLDAGVEEIAQEAGVGVGTLYRRFPTKDALVSELVHEALTTTRQLAVSAQADTAGDGLEQFLYAVGQMQADNRGCLARLWTDDTTIAARAECRELIAVLLTSGQLRGRIRDDATLTDIDLVFWSLRGVLEMTSMHDPVAWRRHIALTVAGLRPSTYQLAEPPVSAATSASVRAATPSSAPQAASRSS